MKQFFFPKQFSRDWDKRPTIRAGLGSRSLYCWGFPLIFDSVAQLPIGRVDCDYVSLKTELYALAVVWNLFLSIPCFHLLSLFTLARYKRYPWLSYDFETKKACCYPSQKYLNAHDFTFDNWKKPECLTKHHKSERHQTAMAKWIDGRANKRNTSVLSKLQESHTQDVKENRDYLELSMNVSCLRRSRTSCSGATMNNVMVWVIRVM